MFTLHCAAVAFPDWFLGVRSLAKNFFPISLLKNVNVFTIMKIITMMIININKKDFYDPITISKNNYWPISVCPKGHMNH